MPTTKSDDRRRTARLPTRINAFAKTGQGVRHTLEISDLSEGGCAVVSAGHPLTPGVAYGLKINGLEVLGSRTAWIDGRSAGLAFDAPLHPAVATHFSALHPRTCDELALDEA
jgi:hypothetical protein